MPEPQPCMGAACELAAVWQLGMDYFPRDDGEYEVTDVLHAHIGLFLCQQHRDDIDIKAIALPNQTEMEMQLLAAGVAPPDWSRNQIHWYAEDEWRFPARRLA